MLPEHTSPLATSLTASGATLILPRRDHNLNLALLKAEAMLRI